MKGDQMGILAAYPTQRELPLSNQTRFSSSLVTFSRRRRLRDRVLPPFPLGVRAMLLQPTRSAVRNLLLRALSPQDFGVLQPHLESVALNRGDGSFSRSNRSSTSGSSMTGSPRSWRPRTMA